MNCHHARQLISPYLDQQLTGREMLALQDHFTGCHSCEREMQSIRQVKALLRGLREPQAPHDFSGAVALRLEQAEFGAMRWRVLSLPLPKPQRGRRLASALALSCLTVVSFVAPFAPEAGDAARSSFFGSSTAFSFPAPNDPLLSGRVPERITLVPASDLSPITPAEVSAPSSSGVLTLTGTNAPTAASGLEMAPRSQDIPFGNVQFALFRPR